MLFIIFVIPFVSLIVVGYLVFDAPEVSNEAIEI